VGRFSSVTSQNSKLTAWPPETATSWHKSWFLSGRHAADDGKASITPFLSSGSTCQERLSKTIRIYTYIPVEDKLGRNELLRPQKSSRERSLAKLRHYASSRNALPRTVVRGRPPGKFGLWLDDAPHCGVRLLQQFPPVLSREIKAVYNAIAEPWSGRPGRGAAIQSPERAQTCGRAGISC